MGAFEIQIPQVAIPLLAIEGRVVQWANRVPDEA